MKKNQKSNRLQISLSNTHRANAWAARLSVAVAVMAGFAFDARAGVIDWAGLSGTTNGWEDTNNWSPLQEPGLNDAAIFTNVGYVATVGLVNNTVSVNTTISNLSYSPISPGGTNTSANIRTHTTAIGAGVTLAVGTGAITNDTTIFYTGADGVNTADVIFASLTGQGTLLVGNPSAPNTNTDFALRTRAVTANSSTHNAELDMSKLNNFVFGGGRFHIGSDAVSQATYPTVPGYTNCDRANGILILAKTNTIIAAFPTVATSHSINFPYAPPAFAMAANLYANSGGLVVQCQLGQQNTICADGMVIGGGRQSATMTFQTNYAGLNPTVKFRGANGTSRVAAFGLGDNDNDHATTAGPLGTLDLSLGSVDALVDVMNVGRCSPIVTTTGAGGTGIMTLAAGTFDVATLNIGCERGNVKALSTGTVNLLGTANLISTGINIGNHTGTVANAPGNGIGTLNINGGTASVSGDIAETDLTGTRGTSTISIQNGGVLNMMPAGDTVPGNILSLGTLSWNGGTLTNYGILGVSSILQPTSLDFTVYPGETLAPYAPGFVGALTVQAGLVLNNATVSFDLNSPASSNDQVIVTNQLTLNGVSTVDVNPINGTITPGTYTLMTYGSLTGGSANLQLSTALTNSRYTAAIDTSVVPNINLNVSGTSSALTWSGDSTSNTWDLKSTSNWTSGTDQFYDLDAVTFDDSGSESPAVNLVGTLSPSSVLVNTGSSYTFAGTGKISGDCSLTNLGAGILTILNTNDYTGPTAINAGTLMVNGKLGNTAVNISNYATLGGTGTILGSVTFNTFAVLTPGVTAGSIGTLAMSNNLTLVANTLSMFDIDADGQTNDQVVGLNKVTYAGILDLNLTGRALEFGDAFKLFDAHVYSGSFSSILPATPGPGLFWNTNTLNSSGTLSVTAPIPVITNIASIGGGNLQISGTGGVPNGAYSVIASADLTVPRANWAVVNSGSFDGSGNFSFTATISGARQFFALSTTP